MDNCANYITNHNLFNLLSLVCFSPQTNSISCWLLKLSVYLFQSIYRGSSRSILWTVLLDRREPGRLEKNDKQKKEVRYDSFQDDYLKWPTSKLRRNKEHLDCEVEGREGMGGEKKQYPLFIFCELKQCVKLFQKLNREGRGDGWNPGRMLRGWEDEREDRKMMKRKRLEIWTVEGR